MDFLIVLKALMMGLVREFYQNYTDFQPGHLIVFGNLIDFSQQSQGF